MLGFQIINASKRAPDNLITVLAWQTETLSLEVVYKFVWATTTFRITVSYNLQRYMRNEKQDKYLIILCVE